jgi:hypothetical protein
MSRPPVERLPLVPRTPRATRAVALVALVALACATLTGCAAPRTEVVVALRDAETHQPVPNAPVVLTAVRPAHPLDIAGMLRKPPESPEPTRTDAAGRVTLLAPDDRPFDVIVWVEGLGPALVKFTRADTYTLDPDDTPSSWRPLDSSTRAAPPAGPDRQGPKWELRLVRTPKGS